MATPHVSGVAALVWGQFPQCSAERIRQVLNTTAKDKGQAAVIPPMVMVLFKPKRRSIT